MNNRQLHNIQRKKLIHAGQMHLIHWLIILLSVVLTFAAWHYSKEQLNQKLEDKFNRNASQAVSLVIEKMALYENALWSGVAFIGATDTSINHNQWLAYAENLNIDQTYPGINGIGIIYNIKPNQLNAYLSKQKELRPNYTIHPKHTNNEYWPITYIEPMVSNKKAVGLDVTFEKNRYSSIIRARDSGLAQLTAPITLVQDSKSTPGFLLYTPFYKDGLKPKTIQERKELVIGAVYAPFIMKNLMQGTLAKQNRQVSIQIHDAGKLLFDDHANSDTENLDSTPLFTTQAEVNAYGRVWAFSIQSNLKFKEESASNQSSFILFGGLTIDALLLGLFLFLSRANRQALNYADQITEALEEKTANLEKSNSDLEQFSYIASHDLKSPLNAIKSLASWIYEDCQDIIPDESKEHLRLLNQRSERMMKLLNDLLAYSRVNRSSAESEVVNLKEMSEDVFDMQDKSTAFTLLAPNIEILVPKSPVEIILRNLISNAIKHHNKANGNIKVMYAADNNYHIISVEDDGPGIPLEFHNKVIEMFQTLNPRDKVEGSGMGLAMVKRITEHHQGKISINSDGKLGTIVSIHWKK